MKQITKLFIIVFFILAVVKTSNSVTYSISGKVRYSDNHEIVTQGYVRFYTIGGIFLGQAEINQNGDYIKAAMVAGDMDLIGTNNTDPELETFIPTGFPSSIAPSSYVHVSLYSNLTNVDIYVIRKTLLRPNAPITNVSGFVYDNNNRPVSDAIVYAKQGNEYYGAGTTNSKGEYTVKNIPQGDYILVAHKLGSSSDSKELTVDEKGANNIVFNVVNNNNNSVSSVDPFDFRLSQNYPNPFNPSTVISYSVPKDGIVTLKVYNMTGEQVSELVSANQNAGTHTVEFNAQNLASGVYYYKLEANGFVDTKKMILVK